MTTFTPDRLVRHARHGEGRVVADLGVTVVVRFGAALEQVERGDLQVVQSLTEALAEGMLGDQLAALTRAQALLIRSVNDQWGVFSRARVQLLPHQLWVCRQVTQEWPARWLVADDVGLGKTIEAGLILTPLMAAGRVRRLLILAPARLVPQWRVRLKSMFDIRLQEYTRAQDRGRISFWETASQVVASFHTLRQPEARARLLAAEQWDMVMVDEAHHFQAQERAATLTYNLLQELQDKGRIASLVLFTGTPHRGKDFGFLALMRLLRPDLFDPRIPAREQLPHLRRAMIRNNKALVTDLQGRRLFQPVETATVDYAYTPAEEAFYRTMSAFILEGRAYALSLTGREQSARMLLLIALQKLAASSIAAILSALERRRAMLADRVAQSPAADLPDEAETLDEAAEQEEALPDHLVLLLMQDEIARLDDLLALARGIGEESKIARLIELIETRLPADEPLLLFTEYKATQALVIGALEARFGKGCAGFINGDERLAVPEPDRTVRLRRLNRDAAAEDFNVGRTRFLVSTEAGGEGIDLQARCAKLVHVDLPWNPMRLHQRVGRLNRYGQSRAVQVFLLRNPATVEARIWELLEAKLARIQAALSATMDEAEDIAQLVIGMQGGRFFNELFAEGSTRAEIEGERLGDWFNAQTATFGGRDAVETVRAMMGNVARFDFGTVGGSLPRLDLPALDPFFRNAMALLERRVTRGPDGLSVATPEAWKRSPDLKPRYDGLVFDRALPEAERMTRLLGVGHPLLDHALTEAAGREVLLGRARGLSAPLMLTAVEDDVTDTGGTVHRVILALEAQGPGNPMPMADWQALERLNGCKVPDAHDQTLTAAERAGAEELVAAAPAVLPSLDIQFRRPRAIPLLCLFPDRVAD